MIWVVRTIAAILIVAALAIGAGYLYLRRSLPQISGSVTLAGITQPVEIVRDRNDVPHIFAKSPQDALFGLGYVHAQDRLWQMEMYRRIASGELSEIFGPRTLDTDKFLRTLGVKRAAESALAGMSAETRSDLAAYAAGVNAFIDGHSGPWPPEFIIVGVRPGHWAPVDSIAWLKMMAWDLGRNWSQELLRLRLSKTLTPKQIAEFIPPYPGDAPTALSGELTPLYRRLAGTAERLVAIVPPPLPRDAGSNTWVVSGKHTASGKPLLANDPHLGLSAPSIWYLAHLDAPGLQIIGATLPGVPLVVLGHNARLAWGFSNTGTDVEDLYVEKIDPANSSNYMTPSGPKPFRTIVETIPVKGRPNETITVRVTRHGPVISDVLKPARDAVDKEYVISLAWTALADNDATLQSGLRIAAAGNWDQFVGALRDFRAPQQDITYADVDGNIGFIAPGAVPIRKPENDVRGLAPVPGWDARYDWAGEIPFDKLPRAFNPPNGEIIAANNKIVPSGYPYFLTDEWAEPYRAQRIEQMLGERDAHSVESFMEIQSDVKSLMVTGVLPLLLKVKPDSVSGERAVALLKDWDGSMTMNRAEPLIVAGWLRELTRLIYADELGDMFDRAWDLRPIFIYNVLSDKDGQSRWCDDVAAHKHQTCDSLVARALDLALVDLRRRYGEDMARWRWGDAHVSESPHRPFTGQFVLGGLFDLAAPSPGDGYTIDVGHYFIRNENEPFASHLGPAFRAIYDLADLDRSVFMQSTGQSGNILSSHYDDFVRRWINVQYVPMTMRRSDITIGALGTITLIPGK